MTEVTTLCTVRTLTPRDDLMSRNMAVNISTARRIVMAMMHQQQASSIDSPIIRSDSSEALNNYLQEHCIICMIASEALQYLSVKDSSCINTI